MASSEFDDAFDEVEVGSRFAVIGAGRRIETEFLEGYPCAQVFAPRNVECICFEPMAAPANALRSGHGLRTLASGDTARARFSLRVRAEPRPLIAHLASAPGIVPRTVVPSPAKK